MNAGNAITTETNQDHANKVRSRAFSAWYVVAFLSGAATLAAGYWVGNAQNTTAKRLPPLLAASASASDTMAVATGPISNDAEGVFFLDFITGDLQCLVYYPRAGTFGAHFAVNVTPNLGGGGRNSKYVMVTGGAISKTTTSGARPGASLVYVTDTTSGAFAAYAVPWNRSSESSGRTQGGALVYVGGGPVRNFQLQNQGQNAAAGAQNNQP